MAGGVLVWQFVPDLSRRRRTLVVARMVVLALTVAVGVVGWRIGAFAGVLVGVAAGALLWTVVESWGRSAVDAGPQRVWVDGDVLRFEGAELFERVRGGEAFEGDQPASPHVTIDLADASTLTAYPSTTRTDGDGPAIGFHLVIDSTGFDGTRRCVVFDRRIPFRLAGELALVGAVRAAASDRWIEQPDDDTFGAIDRRRLADWRA